MTNPLLCAILSPSNDRGALHEDYRTTTVAKAVRERRGCRSGCLGKAFDWPAGDHPSGCRRHAESYPEPNLPQGDIRRIPVVLSLPPRGLFLWVQNRIDGNFIWTLYPIY